MSNKPLRILFVIDYYTPHIGGLEVVFENVISRLLDNGHEVGIITTRHIKTLPKFEKNGNLRIWRVGTTRNNFLRHALRKTIQIAPQYDQVHTTTYAGAIPASLAGLLTRTPVLLTIHEVFGGLRNQFKNRGRPYRFFERLIFQFPYTCYTCVSNYTKETVHELYNIPKEKLHVIYNGVNSDVWDPSQTDASFTKNFKNIHNLNGKLLGLYYGHSGASKGLDQFIKAIPTIVKQVPDFHAILNIIPTNRDHKILKLINDLDLNEHILLLHGLQREQLVNVVNTADFVVVPSISEGFGLVAAEVSQLEKPIITTKNGALPEVVSGKVIYLDSLAPTAIADAVEQVKQKNWETVPAKQFNWEDAITHYEKLYQTCTKRTA